MSVRTLELPVRIYREPLRIFGGPFREFNRMRHDFGVKLAPEVDRSSHLEVPIADFSVPTDIDGFEASLLLTFRRILNGEKVYAGCVGGTGRTGLFFAVFVKALGELDAPVTYVRKHYKASAVETNEQERFVEDFDVTILAEAMRRSLWRKRLLPFLAV